MTSAEEQLYDAMLALVNAGHFRIYLEEDVGANMDASAALRVANLLATRRHHFSYAGGDDFAKDHAAIDQFSEAAEALGIRWWEVKP